MQLLQHPWSHVASTASISNVSGSLRSRAVGMVHHPRVLGPRPHAQHCQLPPMSLNWQFCSGQPAAVGCAAAKLMSAQGDS